MATLGTRLYTLFFGRLAGVDEFGNRYYQARKDTRAGRPRRWVIYKGQEEATKIPPLWHAWIHHATDEVPVSTGGRPSRKWIKPHVPNLSGTGLAYRPPGHVLKGGHRSKATGDYEAWTPKS